MFLINHTACSGSYFESDSTLVHYSPGAAGAEEQVVPGGLGGDGGVPEGERGEVQEEGAHQEGARAGMEGAQGEGDHTEGTGVGLKAWMEYC